MNYALPLCLLVSTSITVTMELVRSSSKESLMFVEKTYSLFVNNQQNAAEKEIKSNDDETMTLSLLKHGIKKNNTDFTLWLLVTKRLSSDDLALQKALEYSQNHINEAANVLKEHVQLRQEHEIYAKNELEKIAQAKKSLSTKSSLTPQKGWSARQAAPGENDTWEEKMKNAKPIPEARYIYIMGHDGEGEWVMEEEDCKCIIL